MTYLTPPASLPCGYASSSTAIIFISSSEFRVDVGRYTVPHIPAQLHDVEGIGSYTPGTVYTVVDLDNYLSSIGPDPTAENNRIYFARNIGSFGYPSWKQTRHDYHPVYLALKKTSNLVHLNPSIVGYDLQYNQIRERLGTNQTKYDIPYMTSKFRPLFHGYEELVKFKEIDIAKPMNLRYDYSNLLAYFPIEEIDNKLRVVEKESLVYTSLYDKYIGNEESDIGDFRVLRYSEIVWPKEENTFLDKIRSRPNFVFNWKDKREERTEASGTNSQGHIIPTASMWPLDAREGPYRTETLFTTASTYHKGDVGELLSVSSVYHNGDTSILTASALFSYPMPDSSSAGVFFTNDTDFSPCV